MGEGGGWGEGEDEVERHGEDRKKEREEYGRIEKERTHPSKSPS